MAGLRIGVLEEGFQEADSDVSDLVMAAVDVLAQAGAQVSKVSIPEHHAVRDAQMALMSEGSRAVFDTGFFGAFTKTYYPAGLIGAINRLWANQADLLNPRTKLGYITAEFSRRNYYGRVYAKAQNVRPAYVRAFDSALQDLDVLVMPTCLGTAPRYAPPASSLEALEENLSRCSAVGRSGTRCPTTIRATRPWRSRSGNRAAFRSACSSSEVLRRSASPSGRLCL